MIEAAILDNANLLVSQLALVAVCINFTKNAGKPATHNLTYFRQQRKKNGLIYIYIHAVKSFFLEKTTYFFTAVANKSSKQ